MDKEEKKENYFLGIIGAVIVGLIFTIALTFAYIFSNWLPLLIGTIIIPFIEFYGYKIFKGKIDKRLPIILLVITIINVLIMSLVLIPMSLLIKSQLKVNFGAIQNILKNNKLFLSVLQDSLISLALSSLGVYIVSCIVNRKILLNVKNIKLFSSDTKEKQEFKQIAIRELKPIFEKYDAKEKTKTITKEEVLADVKDNKYKQYFKFLCELKIIKKCNGKYYYCDEQENNVNSHYVSSRIVSSTSITIAICVIVMFLTSYGLNSKSKKIYNNDVSFKIDTSWNEISSYTQQYGWIYYKYLDLQDVEQQADALEPATIGINYDNKIVENRSINDVKETIELYINSSPEYGQYRLEVFKTDQGYEAMEIITAQNGVAEYDYYICKDGKIAFVTAIYYSENQDRLDILREYAKDIVNSFRWNK